MELLNGGQNMPTKKCNECGFYYTEREHKDKGIITFKRRQATRPYRDENNKIIWKNFLLPDMYSVMIIIILILVALSYKHDINAFKQDIKKCDDVIKNPDAFCGRVSSPFKLVGSDVNASIIKVGNLSTPFIPVS